MDLLFEKKHSPDFGHYLISKMNYQFGDTIYEESPLMVVPHNEIISYLDCSKFLCVGCFKIITTENTAQCPRCRWYLCCEQCSDEPWHKNFECGVFKNRNVEPSLESLGFVYLVRSLLYRENDVSKFNQLLQLSSTVDVENFTLKFYFDMHTNEACRFLNNRCKIAVEADLVKKLAKLFYVNRFGIEEDDLAGNKYNGDALFSTSCLLAHSCSPNANWILLPTSEDKAQRWRLKLEAMREINVGEMVTITYNASVIMDGTLSRRHQIREDFNFECKCQRCSDGSECGTNFCGIKCEKCPGVLLPEKPLESKTNWKCVTCNKTLPIDAVKNLEDIFKEKLKFILEAEAENKDSCCEQLDVLIEEGSVKYGLHPNHKLIVVATMQWLSRVDFNILQQMGSEADKLFAILKSRVEECQKIFSAIGALFGWATCEEALAVIIIKHKFKSSSGLSIDYDNYSLMEKRAMIKDIVMHCEMGLRVIKGKYYIKLQQSLEQIHDAWSKCLNSSSLKDQVDDDMTQNG